MNIYYIYSRHWVIQKYILKLLPIWEHVKWATVFLNGVSWQSIFQLFSKFTLISQLCLSESQTFGKIFLGGDFYAVMQCRHQKSQLYYDFKVLWLLFKKQGCSCAVVYKSMYFKVAMSLATYPYSPAFLLYC